METTLSYLMLFLALDVQIVNNEARMSSICLSNEKAGTRIDALVAKTLGLTSIIPNCPGFPEIQIQQCDVSWATTGQKTLPLFKELTAFAGSKLFEHLVGKPRERSPRDLVRSAS